MTDKERQLISTPPEERENKHYQAVSRVRNKVQEELPKDIEILTEHHPDLLEELKEVVCNEGND